jgi:hypothetical protein
MTIQTETMGYPCSNPALKHMGLAAKLLRKEANANPK